MVRARIVSQLRRDGEGYDGAVANLSDGRPSLPSRPGDARYGFTGFLVRLALYLGGAMAVAPLLSAQSMQPFKDATAALAAALFGLFSDSVSAHGDIVAISGGFSVQIVSECFGLLEMAIFASAVLAFATTWRKRLIGLAFGLPVIFAFNLLRIGMLLFVGRHSRAFFEFAHLYFWQATLVLGITALWLLWVRFVVRDEASAVVRA
jgi:exosortase H (IPTLxxWG-CTERM-specific)